MEQFTDYQRLLVRTAISTQISTLEEALLDSFAHFDPAPTTDALRDKIGSDIRLLYDALRHF